MGMKMLRQGRRRIWGMLVLGLMFIHPGWGQGQDALRITDLQLRKDQGQLKLHFICSAPPAFRVVENLSRRVVVIKFANAQPALTDGKTRFLFNDPMVEGVAFEQVGADSWAKIRLRGTNLAFSVSASPRPQEMVIGFSITSPSNRIELTDVRLRQPKDSSRVVLRLSRPPRYETERVGDRYTVRLTDVVSRLASRVKGADERVELLRVSQEGRDAVVEMRIKDKRLAISPLLLTNPPQLVFIFQNPQAAVSSQPAPPPQRGESLQNLLDATPNRTARAAYLIAEREMRAGKYAAARRNFLRVYNADTRNKLGIRAYIRATDAQYELLHQQNLRNYHNVIIDYQTAIRAAERAAYETELIPHAFFHIGRAYQQMAFHHEANVHFGILQNRFPNNDPYGTEAYYYQGLSFIRTDKHEKAIKALRGFLKRTEDSPLIPAAYYALGESFYNLKRYTQARKEFDRARRRDLEYPKDHPILLFRMGETYYENAEFNLARTIYRQLLALYPDKPYTKLVGLRLGDFLREEGREEDALRLYGQVTQDAPLEIRLRGQLRIAAIHAQKPVGDAYKKALSIYDEVIAKGESRPVAAEALLRKALALTLHHRHQEALEVQLDLAQKHPKSPFVTEHIVDKNVVENLKSLMEMYFAQKKYWEVVKLYNKHQEQYFGDFPYRITLFQVAVAYHALGLYTEALRHYNALAAQKPKTLTGAIAFQKARLQVDKDDLGAAEAALLGFINTYPQNPYGTDARMLLGRVYFDGRRYQDALDAYQIILHTYEKTKDPDMQEALPQVYYQLGNIHKELGKPKEAEAAYRDVVKHFHHPLTGPNVPEHVVLSQYLRADALFALEQDQDALVAYEDVGARYPRHDKTPWAQFQIGLIHQRNGREREALKVFNQLVELAKSRPGELWETLAKANQRDLVNALGYQDYLKK